MPVRLRSSGRTPGIAALLSLPCLLLVLIFSPAVAQQAQIGIYNDTSRSSCALSDAGGGQIRAYVVVNSTSGITGVRFSAPRPACFNATWVADEVPGNYVFIGDSQTDISIATGGCQTGLLHVLTMVFEKTSTTTPCCQFSILPAQEQDDVVYTDCSFTQLPLATTSAYINGDATCPCSNGLNNPPSAPFNPYPSPNYINVPSELTLTWEATDPENDPLTYDVFLGTQANPPQIATNLTNAEFHVDSLPYLTKHYWKVVVKDDHGNSTTGPVWTFTVGQELGSPGTPNNPLPENNATDQYRALILNWGISGGSGPVFFFEIHFGTTAAPPVVATIPGSTSPGYGVQDLALDTTYYWYVVSLGENGKKSTGPVWTFHTRLTNPPPDPPASPVPADQAVAVPDSLMLKWSGSDPENQPLEYDVYFGTDVAPPLAAHQTTASYDVSDLAESTTYHWRVVAFDSEGASTSGPVWSFRTRGVGPPTIPQLVTPAEGSTVSPISTQLAWTSSDPEGGQLRFDVYLGKTLPLPIIRSSIGVSFAGVNLDQSSTYFWKVVARDPDGLTTEGPVWSFNTKQLIPPLPPSSPSPSPGAIGVSRNPTLTWQCSDPDSQALHYTVWFGPGWSYMNPYYNVNVKSFTPNETLAAGKTYYWEVWAYDTDGSVTKGPQFSWYFTTVTSGGPPSTPVNVSPPDNATGQPLTLDLKWSSTDPDGFPLTYSVYFGPLGAPQAVASGVTQNFYTVTGLESDKAYSWRIVARDVEGYNTTGPIWNFTTAVGSAPRLAIGLYSDASGISCSLADKGAGLRDVYVVLTGPATYTGARFAATKPACFNATWMYEQSDYVTLGDSQSDISIGFGGCVPAPIKMMKITYLSAGNTQGCCNYAAAPPLVIGQLQVTDCNFTLQIPQSYPALGISSNDACPLCESKGYLAFAETPDTCRVSGAHPFTTDLRLNTAQDTDAASIDVTIDPSLTFVSCQRGTMIEDWPAFTYQLQNGVLHISAAGTTIPANTAGTFAKVTFTSDCCAWTHPAELGLINAGSDFVGLRLVDTQLTCHYAPNGDVNNDGNITVADAQCALETYLYAPLDPPSDCGGPGAASRADVDCNGYTTPADAQCIFRNWLDQSCSFCNGTLAERVTRGPAAQLALRALRENDDIVVVLHATGVYAIGALGFEITYPAGIEFARVEPPRKDTFAALATRAMGSGRLRVGAYTGSGKDLTGDGDILAIRFHAGANNPAGVVSLQEFVDDLDGAAQVSVALDGAAAAATPSQIVLHQNSPNPFNPLTMIRFELPEPMHVRLSVFDVHGRLVKQLLDERREAGASMMEWDGTDGHARTVATGVYFYVLDAGGSRYQHKMVLLK